MKMKKITTEVPRENKTARAAKKTISSLTRYFTLDYLNGTWHTGQDLFPTL
jgi:hypothetical protein